jgi:hypothetical protein
MHKMQVTGQPHVPAALSPGKKPQIPFEWKVGLAIPVLYPGEGPVPRKVVNARAEGRVRDVGRSLQLLKERNQFRRE